MRVAVYITVPVVFSAVIIANYSEYYFNKFLTKFRNQALPKIEIRGIFTLLRGGRANGAPAAAFRHDCGRMLAGVNTGAGAGAATSIMGVAAPMALAPCELLRRHGATSLARRWLRPFR